MMRAALIALFALVPALPGGQIKGVWQAAEPLAYDFTGGGHVYAHFQGYEADPGEPVARIVSFDTEGNISQAQLIWYIGMDSAGVSLGRTTWSPPPGASVDYRNRFGVLQPQIDARSLALDAVLGTPAPQLRQDIRLPPPPVVYRTEVAGLALAGVSAGLEDPRGHVSIRLEILHDTTIVAQLQHTP